MQKLTNNEAKEVAKLKQKKFRLQNKKVIVEGKRTITQLLQNKVPVLSIFLREEEEQNQFRGCNHNTRFYKITEAQQKRMSATKTPQTCFAVLEAKTADLAKNANLICYLDGIKDPGNMGTIIRTIAAAGFDGLVLSPACCDVFNDKTIRSAMGLVFSFPIALEAHSWLKKNQFTTLVTTLNQSIDLFDFVLPAKEKIALIIGSEAHGVSSFLEENADYRIRISQDNAVESLNAGVATGISAFEIKRQLYQQLKSKL